MSHKKISSDFLLSKKMTKNQWFDNRLVKLAPILVPHKFQQEAPQFYELIQSFLMHIQRVQDLSNQANRPQLNIKEINEKEVLELYRKAYIQSLKAPDDSYDIILIKDILEVTKDLSQRKGTYFIFYLLTNILFYLIPQMKTQYDDLLEQLKDPSLSQTRKESLIKQINDFKLKNPVDNLLDVVEEAKMTYSVELNYPSSLFLEYIYPFTHPTGWNAEVGAKIILLFEDMFYKRDTFTITVAYVMKDHEQKRNNIIKHYDNLIRFNDNEAIKPKLTHPQSLIEGKFIDQGMIHPNTNPTLVTSIIWKDEKDEKDILELTKEIYTSKNVTDEFKFDLDEEFYNTWIKNTKDQYKIGGSWKVGDALIIGGNEDDNTFLFKLSKTQIKRINVA